MTRIELQCDETKWNSEWKERPRERERDRGWEREIGRKKGIWTLEINGLGRIKRTSEWWDLLSRSMSSGVLAAAFHKISKASLPRFREGLFLRLRSSVYRVVQIWLGTCNLVYIGWGRKCAQANFSIRREIEEKPDKEKNWRDARREARLLRKFLLGVAIGKSRSKKRFKRFLQGDSIKVNSF